MVRRLPRCSISELKGDSGLGESGRRYPLDGYYVDVNHVNVNAVDRCPLLCRPLPLEVVPAKSQEPTWAVPAKSQESALAGSCKKSGGQLVGFCEKSEVQLGVAFPNAGSFIFCLKIYVGV